MDHHVSQLRRLAEECRHDADLLHHRAASLSWRGLSGLAFRGAADGLVADLRALALALDLAADAVLVHHAATAELSLVAVLTSVAVDVGVEVGTDIVKAVA